MKFKFILSGLFISLVTVLALVFDMKAFNNLLIFIGCYYSFLIICFALSKSKENEEVIKAKKKVYDDWDDKGFKYESWILIPWVFCSIVSIGCGNFWIGTVMFLITSINFYGRNEYLEYKKQKNEEFYKKINKEV